MTSTSATQCPFSIKNILFESTRTIRPCSHHNSRHSTQRLQPIWLNSPAILFHNLATEYHDLRNRVPLADYETAQGVDPNTAYVEYHDDDQDEELGEEKWDDLIHYLSDAWCRGYPRLFDDAQADRYGFVVKEAEAGSRGRFRISRLLRKATKKTRRTSLQNFISFGLLMQRLLSVFKKLKFDITGPGQWRVEFQHEAGGVRKMRRRARTTVAIPAGVGLSLKGTRTTTMRQRAD